MPLAQLTLCWLLVTLPGHHLDFWAYLAFSDYETWLLGHSDRLSDLTNRFYTLKNPIFNFLNLQEYFGSVYPAQSRGTPPNFADLAAFWKTTPLHFILVRTASIGRTDPSLTAFRFAAPFASY